MLKSIVSALLVILFVCSCRLLPHLANFSPLIFLSLFMTRFFSKPLSYLLLIGVMCISDLLLSIHSQYFAFGSWTWFTYSGLLGIAYAGSKVDNLDERFSLSALLILGSSLGFWIWTNFGVWLFSGLYSLNSLGFIRCYIEAVPFLQHSVMSAYMWFIVFFLYQQIRRVSNKRAFQIR